MKTSELSANTVYAYKERPSSWASHPAFLVETALWKWADTWGNWGGSETRTQARVWTRAKKGERPGSSAYFHASSWQIGIPLLVVEASDYRFSSEADNEIVTAPGAILQLALAKMNPLGLFAEGHDGRATGDIKTWTEVQVYLADGSTEMVTVSLKLVRPQSIQKEWSAYVEEARKAAVAKVDYETKRAERQAENDKTAVEIVRRTTALLGDEREASFTLTGERYDLRRDGSGISTTYQVSESVLLKLLALAEKGSSE